MGTPGTPLALPLRLVRDYEGLRRWVAERKVGAGQPGRNGYNFIASEFSSYTMQLSNNS